MPQQSTADMPQDLPTTSSALEFDGISYWDPTKGFIEIEEGSENALLDYLQANFKVCEMMHSGPWLILPCKEIPELAARPFTAAGCIAVWLSENEPYPAELALGDISQSNERITLPDTIARDLRAYRLPQPETLLPFSDPHHLSEHRAYHRAAGVRHRRLLRSCRNVTV